MSEWKEYKLSDFIEINPKVTLKSGTKYSFVEMKDLSESQKFVLPSQLIEIKGGARFQNFDTLFARITPCLQNGKICQVKGLKNSIGFGSTEFLVFRGKEGISNTDFVYYLSRYDIVRKFAEQNMIGTSGRQRVSKDAFENIELFLPDLPTQTAIAEILSSLDDKIELNNKINQELENLAQTLFKQWFIDFEFPNENGEPYKSSGGEMVDSELGEIPEGWEVKSLCKELTIAYGKNLPTTKLEDSGYDVFGGNGIIGKYHSFLYEEPQVLIACRGAASGKINISNRKSFVTNNSLIIEYKISKIINFTYLKYWSLCQDFTKCVSGSAQPQITIENLVSNLILVPDVNIVDFFSETLSSTLVRIDNINSENNELVKLRDTLLPKLISGELEINEISK